MKVKDIKVNVSFQFHIFTESKFIFKKKHSLTPVPHLKNAAGLVLKQICFHVCW